MMFIGALATMTADTWATELGTLSRIPPRLITTGRVIAAGSSGGVSVLDTLAAVAGGATIGLAAELVPNQLPWWIALSRSGLRPRWVAYRQSAGCKPAATGLLPILPSRDRSSHSPLRGRHQAHS